jgi:hypothetical protein
MHGISKRSPQKREQERAEELRRWREKRQAQQTAAAAYNRRIVPLRHSASL